MPKKITKTVNKHDKINGSGKKRCTKATQPLVKERNKIDQPPYVCLLQLFEVDLGITFNILKILICIQVEKIRAGLLRISNIIYKCLAFTPKNTKGIQNNY